MLFSCSQIEASAESYPVQLTASQSLALFGEHIPAMYYNGGSVEIVNFDFWKTSSGITESIRQVFDTDPYISAYLSKNPFGLDLADWSAELRSVNALPQWFSGYGTSGKYPLKEEVCVQEFLIYRWQGQPSNVPSSGAGRGDFQISLEQSIPLDGIERARFAMGYSVATVNDITADSLTSASDLNSTYNLYAGSDSLNPVFTTSNAFRRTSGTLNKFNIAYFPMYNRLSNTTGDTWQTTDYWLNAACCPCPQMALMFCDIAFNEQTTISKQDAIIRGAKGVQCISNTFQESQTADYTEPYVYLILMCPTLWGSVTPPQPLETTPNYSEQIDNIQSGVGDININLDSTNNRLDTIIQQLDDIYENMGVSVDVDVDLTEEGPLSWLATHIDNLGGTIVNGIKGLFVPTQQDLVEFKLSLEQQKNVTFGGMVQADGILSNTVFQRIMRSEPVDYIDMPLLDIPVVDFKLDAETFSNQGFTIIDDDGEDKVRVPLKPDSERWGWFYDLLAWAIDIICTIAVVNMFANKLNGVIVGKKVVELEDDC